MFSTKTQKPKQLFGSANMGDKGLTHLFKRSTKWKAVTKIQGMQVAKLWSNDRV
jgi:hypothetical protein